MLLFVIILVLAFGGLFALQAISSSIGERIHQDSGFFIKRQALWLCLGFIGLFFFSSLSLEWLSRWSPVLMLLSLLSLLLVFVPGIGHSVRSSAGSFSRWLDLGIIKIQPSEFSKLVLICYLSTILSSKSFLSPVPNIKSYLTPIVLIATTMATILLEPQYGTTICMLSAVFLIVYLAGVSIRRLLLIGLSLFPLLGLFALFWAYRLERIYVWLDPFRYRFEGGYQLVTAFRAFQEGSWFGTDLASGTAHRYLTYGHTDFALALFAEDFGWIGVCLLLLTFAAFMWRSFFLLRQVDSRYAFLLGSGTLIMLISQALLNLFLVTGLVPTTGIGLPFLSYGGSSLITMLCLCGLLLNATRQSQFTTSNGPESR